MQLNIAKRVSVEINDSEIIDFCDVLLDAEIAHLSVEIGTKSGHRGRRGIMTRLGNGSYEVKLFLTEIQRAVELSMPMGGNSTVPNSVREGCFFVLAHELRHVWQAVKHKNNKAFWKGSYRRRPCEVDARQFVDSKEQLILSFVDPENMSMTKRKRVDVSFIEEIECIVEFMAAALPVSDDELRCELALSGINNPQALVLARTMLDEIEADSAVDVAA